MDHSSDSVTRKAWDSLTEDDFIHANTLSQNPELPAYITPYIKVNHLNTDLQLAAEAHFRDIIRYLGIRGSGVCEAFTLYVRDNLCGSSMRLDQKLKAIVIWLLTTEWSGPDDTGDSEISASGGAQPKETAGAESLDEESEVDLGRVKRRRRGNEPEEDDVSLVKIGREGSVEGLRNDDTRSKEMKIGVEIKDLEFEEVD